MRGGGANGRAVRVIPCLDVKDGQVVKGVRFAGLRTIGDPAELAAAYEAQGADELVFLDISATLEERATTRRMVEAVRERISIPLCVGGGVGSVEDAARLLEAGADKVSVNSAAVRRPALIDELAARFGSQCVVVAIDAAAASGGGWEVLIRSGETRAGEDAVAWARAASARGAGEILLTSWDRDGTRSGYELPLLRAIVAAVPVPVIASGGAASPLHLLEGIRAGASAVLAASIFHDGEESVASVKDFLARNGVRVRPAVESP